MGAGRGKSRRAQAFSLRRQTEWNVKKWYEFIDSNELRFVNVHKYYLGYGTPAPGRTTEESASKVATELFQDMVLVGAIVLPRPYEADDFIFTVDGGSRPQPKTMLIISRKDKPEKQFEVMDMRDFMKPSDTMSRMSTNDVAERVVATLRTSALLEL
jgi:hypothetical protein